MAVVKADGYGHGATRVSRTALTAGATELGVATIDEALSLRGDGITAPILAWLHAPGTDFAPASAHDENFHSIYPCIYVHKFATNVAYDSSDDIECESS